MVAVDRRDAMRWFFRDPKSSLAILVLIASNFVVHRVAADAPTVTAIRARTDALRESIRTVRLWENDTIELADQDGAEDVTRERMLASLTDKQLQSGHVDVEVSLVVMRLNRRLSTGVVHEIDRRGSRVCLTIVDGRNTVDLAVANELSKRAASSLDQSRTLILEGDKEVSMPRGRGLAVVARGGARLASELDLERLGFIPGWIFDDAYSMDIVSPGDSKYNLVGRRDGERVFEATLDSEKKYQVLALRFYDASQQVVHASVFSDYRETGGQWIAWALEERVARDGNPDYMVTRRQCRAIDLNVDLPSEIFVIPDECRVGRNVASCNPKTFWPGSSMKPDSRAVVMRRGMARSSRMKMRFRRDEPAATACDCGAPRRRLSER